MPTPTGCSDLGGSWLASNRALSGAACIAGKPAPTSCLRSHADTELTGCRDLGGSWLASDKALSGAACIAGKLAPTGCLRSHADTELTGCRDLGGSWLASDKALSGADCITGKLAPTSCLRSHANTELTGCSDLGGSWLASDKALSGADCITGKPHPTSCLRSHVDTELTSCRDLGGSWLASDRALSGAACITGKPHPTSCLRSHVDTELTGCRDLGGSPPAALALRSRAENMAIAGMARGFIFDRFLGPLCGPSRHRGRSYTRSPTAGLQAIAVTCGSGPCAAIGARRAHKTLKLFPLKSTRYFTFYESWLASDRALSGVACITGKPAPTGCLRSHADTELTGCRDLDGSPPAALALRSRAENMAIAGMARGFIFDRFLGPLCGPSRHRGRSYTPSPTAAL